MSWLTEGLQKLKGFQDQTQQDINRSGPIGDFFTNTGGSFTDAYKAAPGSDQLKTSYFDPSRDRGPQTGWRGVEGLRLLARGEDPFNQAAGDTEYNRDIARRAAIVAAMIGGGVAAGAYGAGSAAGTAGAATPGTTAAMGVAPAATPGTMAGMGASMSAPAATTAAAPAAFTPITAAGPVAAGGAGAGTAATSSAAPGSFAAMYGTLGTTGGVGAAGGIGAGSTPGTYGAMAAGSAVPGGSIASNAVAPTAAAAGNSSWLPYAQAGGSILSTLFQGLLQMEKDREANINQIKAKQAEANIRRAEAQNQALNQLIQVWRR